jgi:tetratricopeptide (TPR) repeat protein
VDGRDDLAVELLEKAARLLADQPLSAAKVAVLANRARFHMIADEAEDAIRVGFQALLDAEGLELHEFRAHALNTLGYSRVMIGDRGGIADLERSIAIAAELNSIEAIRGHNNLAALSADLGDLARYYEHVGHALRAAERFGHVLALRWLALARMDELYWTGRWDEMAATAGQMLDAGATASGPIQLIDAHILRARVRVARGDTAGAVEDSEAAADVARETGEPQVAFPALAVHAHALLTAGKEEKAGTVASRLLASWAESTGTLPGSWLPDLAIVLAGLGRGSELTDVAKSVPAPTRWLEAACFFAAGDPARAARVYAEIGSLPDEAYARLRAAESLLEAGRRDEAESELAPAVEFFERVRAETYLTAAAALLAPT